MFSDRRKEFLSRDTHLSSDRRTRRLFHQQPFRASQLAIALYSPFANASMVVRNSALVFRLGEFDLKLASQLRKPFFKRLSSSPPSSLAPT